MKKYAIIEDEQKVLRVVPTKWLTKNRTTLIYPRYKDSGKFQKAVITCTDPENDWPEVTITRFIKCKDDYEDAVYAIKRNIVELPSDQETLKATRSKRAKRKNADEDNFESQQSKKSKTRNENIDPKINLFNEMFDGEESDDESDQNRKAESDVTNISENDQDEVEKELDPLSSSIPVPNTLQIETVDVDNILENESRKNTFHPRASTSEIQSQFEKSNPSLSQLMNNIETTRKTAENAKKPTLAKQSTANKIEFKTAEEGIRICIDLILNLKTKVTEVAKKQENLELKMSNIEQLLMSGGKVNTTSGQEVAKKMSQYFPIDNIERKLETVESLLRRERRFFNDVAENRFHEDIFGITLRTAEVHNISRENARIKLVSKPYNKI